MGHRLIIEPSTSSPVVKGFRSARSAPGTSRATTVVAIAQLRTRLGDHKPLQLVPGQAGEPARGSGSPAWVSAPGDGASRRDLLDGTTSGFDARRPMVGSAIDMATTKAAKTVKMPSPCCGTWATSSQEPVAHKQIHRRHESAANNDHKSAQRRGVTAIPGPFRSPRRRSRPQQTDSIGEHGRITAWKLLPQDRVTGPERPHSPNDIELARLERAPWPSAWRLIFVRNRSRYQVRSVETRIR